MFTDVMEAAANARDGDAVAKVVYADALMEGYGGIPIDEKAALQFYLDSANQGNVDAMQRVAWCYMMGKGGVKENFATAVSWTLKARVLGSEVAEKMLLNLCSVFTGAKQLRKLGLVSYTVDVRLEDGGNPAEVALVGAFCGGWDAAGVPLRVRKKGNVMGEVLLPVGVHLVRLRVVDAGGGTEWMLVPGLKWTVKGGVACSVS